MNVLLLEAGRSYDVTTPIQIGADAPLNGAPTPDRPFGFYNAEVGGGWDVPGEPTPSLRVRNSFGGELECSVAEPITGARQRYGMVPTIFVYTAEKAVTVRISRL
jgi:hypothetical protein